MAVPFQGLAEHQGAKGKCKRIRKAKMPRTITEDILSAIWMTEISRRRPRTFKWESCLGRPSLVGHLGPSLFTPPRTCNPQFSQSTSMWDLLLVRVRMYITSPKTYPEPVWPDRSTIDGFTATRFWLGFVSYTVGILKKNLSTFGAR